MNGQYLLNKHKDIDKYLFEQFASYLQALEQDLTEGNNLNQTLSNILTSRILFFGPISPGLLRLQGAQFCFIRQCLVRQEQN